MLRTKERSPNVALTIMFTAILFLGGCAIYSETVTIEPDATSSSEASPRELEIVTVLPPGAIPAIDDPQFLSADEADKFYSADEMVLGVEINGIARAYSIPFLSGHEIVNDTVGGRPIAVTW